MSTEQNTAGTIPAGRGRLAQVIATRGGLAAPEAPFVIEHREALIYMLCEAAELEHGIMCQYLFAAFSLKQSAGEGLTQDQAAAVTRWRKQVSHVATQEMLHLALVQNLLSAIGAAPHLSRPNLPAPASHYPAGVQLALLPFGEQALRHFMFLERPEGMDLGDTAGLAAVGRAAPVLSERDIVPRGQDFATVGHLYRSIEAGFDHLVSQHGEDWLFVGPPRAQATQEQFRWPELVAVTDLASARRAIEEILEQGEGPRGDWRDAHFGQFVNILDEYLQMRQANPAFDPVRPVMAANVRPPERDVTVPLITDPLTARVTDLFNVGYEILLQIFERYFAHTEETDAQLRTLADATIGLMERVIGPLGGLITTLPVGEGYPGRAAGPSFELFYESDYLLPHRQAAWALLAERIHEASWLCEAIQDGRGRAIADRLDPVHAALREISRSLAVHLPAGSPHSGLAAPAISLDRDSLDALLRRAADLAAAAGDRDGTEPSRRLSELVSAVHAIVTQAASGQGCDAGEQAIIVPRLVDSVLRPLADIQGHSAGSPATTTSAAAVPPPRRPELVADRIWAATKTATTLRTSLGMSGSCPPELAEATAALQDLACRLSPAAGAQARASELWQLQSGLQPTVQTESNGPYLATNVGTLADYLGAAVRPVPQLALCRCGNSAIKPLCDGAHARTGFTDQKDSKRVPDRRDTYVGQQVTIFDNRGICQHSGLCTDRVAAVFRAGAEPFVAPSGGRMDEIIRAVRDCPSGALSYAIDESEARDQVDRGNSRPPAVEVTKDGPYRITGGVRLVDADGDSVPRAHGASLEHYALCRCGHSQNKPFCSGMHWYVNFRDPAPEPGREPTLFEWAGGLPGLTRMTRLLYEKHVPDDPVLAPAFADMQPDQPQRLARWLGQALGGPGRAVGDANGQATDPRHAVGFSSGEIDAEQRNRWTSLVAAAADEAGMPADTGFRSAFASCIEWLSRAAAGPAGPEGSGQQPTPTWDWGPGGPPTAEPDQEADTGQEQEPEVALPGPGEPVSFAAHIKPLFRPLDRQSMRFAFDLWSYDDVRTHAEDILDQLHEGAMPCDGAWPETRTDVFERWTDTGMQP